MPENHLNNLVLVAKPAPTSATEQVSIIIPAYKAAVAALEGLPENQFKQQRNRLFWGSRYSARVDGVRDAETAEKLFGRCIMNGMAGAITQDMQGNHRYCFKLSHQYFGKGKTSYVRIGDLREKHLAFLANVKFGLDYDEASDTEHIRPMAPDVSNINSQVITIIMNADNTKFVEWFCGEPKKIYNSQTILLLLDEKGELIFDNVWVQLGMDYSRRTAEKQKYRNNLGELHQPVQTSKSGQARSLAPHSPHQHQHSKRVFAARPLTSMAAALTIAGASPEIIAKEQKLFAATEMAVEKVAEVPVFAPIDHAVAAALEHTVATESAVPSLTEPAVESAS